MRPVEPNAPEAVSPINSSRGGAWPIAVGIGLVVLTLICFWPAGRLPFLQYEDPFTISKNPMIQQGVTKASILWSFKSTVTCNWQPLTSLSHMLAWQLWETDASKHHLVNVFIHSINVLLLFVVLRRMTGSLWRSALVAAFFGWHPMHVESVAWVSERKDVLSSFFFLLTIGAYGEYALKDFEKRRAGFFSVRGVWYCLALVFFALGLMSKPSVVTLPCVLMLLDYWPLGRILLPGAQVQTPTTLASLWANHWKRLLLEKAPFFALTVAACVTGFLVQKATGSLPTLDSVSMTFRVENALASYVFYLKQFICPLDMGVFYLLPHSIPAWQTIGAVLILLGLSAVAIWRLRAQPYIAVGWFWFFGMLVPMIGLVQTGMQSHTDHHTYLSYIGLNLIVVWGGAAWLAGLGGSSQAIQTEPRPASILPLGVRQMVASVLVLVALAGCWFGARKQLTYWQDGTTLFQHTLEVTTANEAVHNMLGILFLDAGRRDEAVEQFQQTLQIEPSYPYYRSHAFENLGLIHLQQHKLDQAAEMFTEAIKIRPDSPKAHFNLGAVYGQRGQMSQATAEFEHVANLPPNSEELEDAELQTRVSRALIRCGKADEAIKHCRDLVAARPQDPAFRSMLGGICLALKQPGEAVQHFKEAIDLEPRSATYLNQLAGVLASSSDSQIRNGTEAVALAERACELTHQQNAAYLDTLGMAYAEANRFPEAISAAEAARALALAAQDQRSADGVARKLELYHAGMPYHEASRGN